MSYEFHIKIGRVDEKPKVRETPRPGGKRMEQKNSTVEAVTEPFSLDLLLQASVIVGYRQFKDRSLISDQVLEEAIRIFSTELEYSRQNQQSEEYKEREDVLQGHLLRTTELYDYELQNDFSDNVILEADNQRRTFNYALNPFNALRILKAEQRIRTGSEDINKLPPLTALSSVNPIRQDDFERLFQVE